VGMLLTVQRTSLLKRASMTGLRTQINNVRLVILFLEVLEDFRDLSLIE